MNILGIQGFFYGHAAALVSDGRLEFFLEEEKLDRIKAPREGFPLQAIRAALDHAGITLEDVDEIVFPWHPWRYAWTVLRHGIGSLGDQVARRGWAAEPPIGRVSLSADRAVGTMRLTPPFLRSLIRHGIRYGGIPGRIPKVTYVSHHRAHAASVFFSSGMDEAAVVIVDGMGERESTTTWRGRGLSLDPLDHVDFPNSLGEFYAAFTEFCGFRTYNQEGKLMGLAAYGEPDAAIAEKMGRVIQVEDERYRVDPRYTIDGAHSYGASFSDAVVELFGEPRPRDGEITERDKRIAFAAQDLLERAVLEIVKKAVRLTECRKVCLSGGVAMNCKLNGAILHSGIVDDLFVLPASNDAGAALGAALQRAKEHGDDPRFALEHAYYGPEFDDEEIEKALKNVKVPYKRIERNNLEEVADLLIARNVVGLYTGRNEFGARALGARSILADPRDRDTLDIVNASVKFREKWRPFAPVILEGYEDEYFRDARISRFMMKAFQVRPEKAHVIPAVVHVDGTCRPQSIRRELSPMYFDILDAFHRKTGVPVLLNTSFNVRGEPIVCRPIEALRCYLGTGMDALVIGSFLLKKDGVRTG
jgi:carbamoyltransferase